MLRAWNARWTSPGGIGAGIGVKDSLRRSYKKMPQIELPEIGEAWTNEYANVTGFVVKVEGTLVTFVSLTGVRASCQFDRRQNPWKRAAVKPRVFTQCSRNGCSEKAFFIYERPYKGVEVVCPLHIPKGVRSGVLQQDVAQDLFEGRHCKKCGEDATEVLGQLEPSDKRTMWNCQQCSTWWIHQNIRHIDRVADAKPLPSMALPEGYRYESHTSAPDPFTFEHHHEVYVKMRPGHTIHPARPRTIYDYVMEDL
jgi:hypothetical protein